MRILLLLLIPLSACDLKLPIYKLAGETDDLKYHKLIPTHSLPSLKNKKNIELNSAQDKILNNKIRTLQCKSEVLKNNKNEYSSGELEKLIESCIKNK